MKQCNHTCNFFTKAACLDLFGPSPHVAIITAGVSKRIRAGLVKTSGHTDMNTKLKE